MPQFIYEWVPKERLDRFLATQSYTRNFINRLVARGDITVNQKVITKNAHRLHPWDLITIIHPERYMENSILAQSPRLDLHIIKEKKDYLVVYKPKGVLSHPNSVWSVEHPNIVGALYHYFVDHQLPSTGTFIRAWLIHRLDKETDGLMLVAKTEAGLAYFKDLFQRKSLAPTKEEKDLVPLTKSYRAQCLLTKDGETFLAKIDPWYCINSLVKPRIPHYEPKQGITKIESRRITQDPTRVELILSLYTWRTHQIRVHLSERGLPICWDYLYNPLPWWQEEKMALTAFHLSFIDNEGELIVCEV